MLINIDATFPFQVLQQKILEPIHTEADSEWIIADSVTEFHYHATTKRPIRLIVKQAFKMGIMRLAIRRRILEVLLERT